MQPRETIRKRLIEQRRAFFRQAATTEEDLLWLETDVEPEFQERGQQERAVQFLDRMDARLKKEIEAIDEAMVRLETGRYGLCEGCHKEITEARLQALPATTLCLACAAVKESSTGTP